MLNSNFMESNMEPSEAYWKCFSEVKRNHELEQFVAKSPMYSIFYAKNLIGGRFELAEPVIGADIYCSFEYLDLIKQRFKAMENNLKTKHFESYFFKYIYLNKHE